MAPVIGQGDSLGILERAKLILVILVCIEVLNIVKIM